MKHNKIFLKKKKQKGRQYGCEHHKNRPKDEKQNLLENRKNIIE